MRLSFKHLALALLAVALSAQPAAAEAAWSAADPLSVPQAERLRWLRAGNLAPNPSFEESSSGSEGFAVCGWSRVGERVEGEIAPEEAVRRGREWVELLERRLASLRRLLPEGHRLPEELAEHLERQRARLETIAGRPFK